MNLLTEEEFAVVVSSRAHEATQRLRTRARVAQS
jgi:hypothetical protein